MIKKMLSTSIFFINKDETPCIIGLGDEMFGVLNLQSSYTMLKNCVSVKDLVAQGKKLGYDFIALSDENMHGMLSLYNEAKKYDIKPVLGLVLSVTYDVYETSFLVFVKDDIGYQNILILQRLASTQKLELNDLKTYQKGLIFVSKDKSSIINKLIINDDLNGALSHMNLFKSSFDAFYLGLSLDTFELEMKVAPKLYELSEHAHIKLLPLHQTSYLQKEDKAVYEALVKIGDENCEVKEDENYAFLSKSELKAMFMDYPFVFDTLSTVIESISFDLKLPSYEMPKYKVEQATSDAYLKSLSTMGLKKRLSKIENPDHKVYQKRLLYELSVIHNMGFDDYFLIVYDFVKYAKTHDILVGPGRGSSAGSLVAYCLGITDVDPIAFDLLFERFLNPERISMPDIDMDFPDDKRDEVLQYVKEKYGKHHVISIVTFGSFQLRSSIRDIAKVMKIDPTRISGIIQSVINDKIDTTDAELMRLLHVAKQIEGLPRHTGTHAAGMIFAHQDLTQSIPLQMGINDFYQSQFEASDLESLGLLKIDFLGIRNLSVIDQIRTEIQKTNKDFLLTDIPYDDAKTYELLQQAETSGIFQLESLGMRAVLRKLKPNTFEDIVAILALFRPGPMDHIDEYILRRNGKHFDYVHDDLKPILDKTYGIIVYQEQIMRIAHEFAGYTLAEADLLRRGISKKDIQILEKERLRFVERCVKKGYPKETGILLYDYIVKFADYGFNRSHSVAYAMVAYQMAYLKANYFSIFMTILLSSVTGNEGLTSDYLNEIKRKHLRISPPNINLSTDQYIILDDTIYLPLLAIKSIGKHTVKNIMEEREIHGPYKDYPSLKRRLKKEINEKNLEMLIHSGALDFLNLNHQTMIFHKGMDDAGYEQYITDFKLQEMEEYNFSELAQYEIEALGFNMTYHPLNVYQDYIEKHHLQTISDVPHLDQAVVVAYIRKIKKIKTKQGHPMAFVELDDGISMIEATLFNQTFKTYEAQLTSDIQLFKLKKNTYKNQVTYVIDDIKYIKQ